MKKSLLITLLCLPAMLFAQDPGSRIPLKPFVYNDGSLPYVAETALMRKVSNIANINGFASTSDAFLLAAEASVLNTEVAPTVPPKYISEVQVSMHVINTIDKVIVGSNMLTFKGIGKSTETSVVNALNNLQPKSAPMLDFISQARIGIVKYYETQMPIIISKAKALSATDQYEEALVVLVQIPECVEGYVEVQNLMVEFYTAEQNRRADELLLEAKGALAKKDYISAIDCLSNINPICQRDEEIASLLSKANKYYDEEFARNYAERLDSIAFAHKYAEKQLDVEKVKFENAKEVAIKKYEAEAFAHANAFGNSDSIGKIIYKSMVK